MPVAMAEFFGCVAQMRREDHGEKLVKALLQQLQAHREDDWVEWITSGACRAGVD